MSVLRVRFNNKYIIVQHQLSSSAPEHQTHYLHALFMPTT